MVFSGQRILVATVLVGGVLVVIDRVRNEQPVLEPNPATTVSIDAVSSTDASPAPIASAPVSVPAPASVIVSSTRDVPRTDPPSRAAVYALTGTSLSTGEPIGFLHEVGSDRTWSVRKGDHVGDAVVVDVTSDHVTLEPSTGQQVVSLGDAPVAVAATAQPATSQTPRLVGGEPADGDSGAEEVPVVPVRRSAAPVPPAITGPAPTLNSIDPAFDPAHQKGESANADDGSD